MHYSPLCLIRTSYVLDPLELTPVSATVTIIVSIFRSCDLEKCFGVDFPIKLILLWYLSVSFPLTLFHVLVLCVCVCVLFFFTRVYFTNVIIYRWYLDVTPDNIPCVHMKLNALAHYTDDPHGNNRKTTKLLERVSCSAN